MEMIDYYLNSATACMRLGDTAQFAQDLQLHITHLSENATSFFANIYNTIYSWAKESIFWYQILLSTISAYIFYFFFTTLPFWRNKSKIRPLMDYELFRLRMNLSRFFDIVMSGEPSHPAVMFQEIIVGGKLTEEKISLSLQSKCLNQSAYSDRSLQRLITPIGQDLIHTITEAEFLIDKASGYDKFILPDEIKLLEQIRQKMMEPILNRDVSMDVIKNCAYLSTQFFDLYLLFCDLQEVVFSRTQKTREWHIFKASYLSQSGQDKKCISFCKTAKKLYPEISKSFYMYMLMSQFRISPGRKFHSNLKRAIKNSDLYEPAYSPLLLSTVQSDERSVDIFRSGYGDEKINEALRSIEKKKQQIIDLENTNMALKEKFDNIELDHFLEKAKASMGR